jgi:hypothetical protein
METKERSNTMRTVDERIVEKENKAISRRADEELFNRGNVDVADELFAPSFVFHDPANHEDWHGPESVKQFAVMMRAAFPTSGTRSRIR